jgi:zinc transport system permease protein
MNINFFDGFLNIILLSCLLAPLGCVSLWRKSTYMADGLSHAGVLANTIAGIFLYNVVPLGTLIALVLVLVIYWLEDSSDIYVATNIVSMISVASAVLIWHLYPSKVHIQSILLGSTCCHRMHHFVDYKILIWLVCLCATFICVFFRQLVFISFNRDLAIVSGVNVKVIDALFFIFAAIAINVAVSGIGMFLVSALLILPAASSKFFSSTPLKNLVNSVAYAFVMSFVGTCISKYFKIPLAPTIAMLSFGTFLIIYSVSRYVLKVKSS